MQNRIRKIPRFFRVWGWVPNAWNWGVFLWTLVTGGLLSALIASAFKTWKWYWEAFQWAGIAVAFLGTALSLALIFILVSGGVWLIRNRSSSPSNPSESAAPPSTAAFEPRIEALEHYVLPRELTESQTRSIEEFLLKRRGHELKVIFQVGNSEANKFAAQLYNVFRLAQWKVTLEASKPDEIIPEGMDLKVVGPHDHGEGKTARDSIQRALSEAGVEIGSHGWSASQDATSPFAVLRIGHKRRR